MRKFTVLIFLVLLNSCTQDKDEPINPIEPKTVEPNLSTEANLLKLELEYEGTTYTTSISGTSVTLSNRLPYGIKEVTIKTIQLSDKAKSDKKVGDKLQVSDNPISIEVTAEDETIKLNYQLNLVTKEKRNNFSANDHYLLFKGVPLDIKGVVYTPNYPGHYPWDLEHNVNLPAEYEKSIFNDIKNIKELGANTIRLWTAPKYTYQAIKELGGLYILQTIWINGEPQPSDFQNANFKAQTKY